MKKYELQLDSPHKMYDDVSSKYEENDNLSLNTTLAQLRNRVIPAMLCRRISMGGIAP